MTPEQEEGGSPNPPEAKVPQFPNSVSVLNLKGVKAMVKAIDTSWASWV